MLLAILYAMLWCRDWADDRNCLLDDIAFVVAAVLFDLAGIDIVVLMVVERKAIVAAVDTVVADIGAVDIGAVGAAAIVAAADIR